MNKKEPPLDEKNALILNLLQEDCRLSLTKISQQVNLSVDAVKKRMEKMKKKGFFYPKIQIRPRKLGFGYIADIKIKLHNYTDKELYEFIEYLKENPHIAEVFSISGGWDFSIVIISRNAEELGKTGENIRSHFNKIINEWSESITTCAHKFEKYDLLRLMGHVQKEEK